MGSYGTMTCDECGFEDNTTLKYPCGGCEEEWQPNGKTLINTPSGEIAHLNLGNKLKYIEMFGGKTPDEVKVHSAFGVAKPSMIIEGKPKVIGGAVGGTYHISLNTKEKNTDALAFPIDEDGNAIVPQSILQQCAENLDRLRNQRNEIRKQWQELQREHMRTLGQNPVEIRRSMIKGIMTKWDKFVARRRTIWDEPGLSSRQRAQRVRRCNEEATVIMHELLSAVMSGKLEDLPVGAEDVTSG